MTGSYQAIILTCVPAGFFRSNRNDSLKRRGGHGPEQLSQVRAAQGAADQLIDLGAETLTNLNVFYFGKVGYGIGADIKGPVFCRRLRLVDNQIVINGDSQPHFVYRFTGSDRAPVHIGKIISLGIDQVTLDIPQIVVTAIPITFDTTFMYKLAPDFVFR